MRSSWDKLHRLGGACSKGLFLFDRKVKVRRDRMHSITPDFLFFIIPDKDTDEKSINKNKQGVCFLNDTAPGAEGCAGQDEPW